MDDIEYERRQEAVESLRDNLWEEFEQSYSDFEMAKLFVENGDESLTLEEFKEMEFDNFCENR